MHKNLVNIPAANATPILRLHTTSFTSQKRTSYHNIVLGKYKQDLQWISQNLRPLLHDFIFVADRKNSGDDFLEYKTNYAVLF